MDGCQAGPGLQEGKTPLKSPQLATVLLSRVPGCLVSGVQEGQGESGAQLSYTPRSQLPGHSWTKGLLRQAWDLGDRQPPQGQA